MCVCLYAQLQIYLPFLLSNQLLTTDTLHEQKFFVWARSSSRCIQSGIGLYPKNEMCEESPASGLPLLYQLLTLRPTLVEFVIGLKSSFPLSWEGTGRGRQRRPLGSSSLQSRQLCLLESPPMISHSHVDTTPRFSEEVQCAKHESIMHWCEPYPCSWWIFSDHNHIKCQSSKSRWNDTQKESWSLLRRKVAEWGCGRGCLTGWVSRV